MALHECLESVQSRKCLGNVASSFQNRPVKRRACQRTANLLQRIDTLQTVEETTCAGDADCVHSCCSKMSWLLLDKTTSADDAQENVRHCRYPFSGFKLNLSGQETNITEPNQKVMQQRRLTRPAHPASRSWLASSNRSSFTAVCRGNKQSVRSAGT